MAKSKSKSKGNSSGAATTTAVRVLLWVCVLGLLATALWLAGRTAWRKVAAHERFAVRPAEDFVLGNCPAWVNAGAMRGELAREIAPETPGAASIFYPHGPVYVDNAPDFGERSIPQMIADALSDCPWLAEVRRVSRKLPDGFVLDVRFRKPAGVVAWLGHRYLVDRNGHYLGPQDDLFRMPPEHGGPDAPVIYDEQIKVHARGVMERNPFDPRWPAPRLAVGARLHLFLLEHGVYDEINVSRIDVTWVDRNAGNTYVGGRPQAEVTLYTEEGLEIRWGKTSAYDSIEAISEPPARDTDERKLQRLYTIMERHAQFPYLDAPVDLRLERAEPAGTR